MTAMQRMIQSGGDRVVNYKKYDKLLKDLERDSVDTDILDEELKRLQETEPRTCRGRTAKLIESSPLHITICILILIDVAIVTTEILMDMHAMRTQYLEATNGLLEATKYLRETHPDVLVSYEGDSIDYMLEVVRTKSTRPQSHGRNTKGQRQHQFRDSVSQIIDWLRSTDFEKFLTNTSREDSATTTYNANRVCTTNCSVCLTETLLEALVSRLQHHSLLENEPEAVVLRQSTRNRTQYEDPANSTGKPRNITAANPEGKRHAETGISTKTIQQASHIMHYIGIGIVGLFALQVFVKMYALGFDFFRQKMEVFDGIITLTSFGVDVVTLEGVSATQSEETIAVLVIFLLWRVLRLANALLVAAKQRQEFRIKLQKRGRQRSDKKIEWLESDLNWKKREIDLLVRLCIERGATEEEISVCRPKNNFPKLNASAGLSSVASFSLGLSMSMRGASDDPTNQAGIRRIATITNSRKQSFQELFPVRPAAHHHHSHRHDQSSSTSASAPVASSISAASPLCPSTSSSSKKPSRLCWTGNNKRPPPEAHQLLASSVTASPMEEISEEERTAREETILENITIDFRTFEGTPAENEAGESQDEVRSSLDEARSCQNEVHFLHNEAPFSNNEAPFSHNEASSHNEATFSYNEAPSSHNGPSLSSLNKESLSIPTVLLPDVADHVTRSEPERPIRPYSVAVISGFHDSADNSDIGCYRNSVCSPVSSDVDNRCISSHGQCAPHHDDAPPGIARQYWSRLRRHVIK